MSRKNNYKQRKSFFKFTYLNPNVDTLINNLIIDGKKRKAVTRVLKGFKIFDNSMEKKKINGVDVLNSALDKFRMGVITKKIKASQNVLYVPYPLAPKQSDKKIIKIIAKSIKEKGKKTTKQLQFRVADALKGLATGAHDLIKQLSIYSERLEESKIHSHLIRKSEDS